MAKGKQARSRRSGGKKGRGANPQTRRNLPACDPDDPLNWPESVGFNGNLPVGEGEGEIDEEGEGHPSESSSAPSFLSLPSPLYPLPQMS